jgi:hypothetical protein
MTASPVSVPAGIVRFTTSDNAVISQIHARRVSAALIFAQETMNNHEDRAAAAFADFFEASIDHQLAWSAAKARAGRE